jgi:hypothetical protein
LILSIFIINHIKKWMRNQMDKKVSGKERIQVWNPSLLIRDQIYFSKY